MIRSENKASEMRLFQGERILVIIGLLGFVLAAGIAVYIGLYGTEIPPEGSAESAFSFDAAIGIFILSVAAFLPLSGLSPRKRAGVRWFFIISVVYSYAIETIQHFRGINPRFSNIGGVADQIAGALFGLDAILIVIVTALLAIPYFRKRQPDERPLLVLGIRYAFISLMFAFAAGIWMIVMQGRFTGAAGNLIVLHGLGFHALQTLPLLGWLQERAGTDEQRARRIIHIGSVVWTISIILICLQTALGRSVFELTTLPILAGAMLLVWVLTVIAAGFGLLWLPSGSAVQPPNRIKSS